MQRGPARRGKRDSGNLGGLRDTRRADGFVKRVHIFEHVAAGRAKDGRAAALLANLAEERPMLNREG